MGKRTDYAVLKAGFGLARGLSDEFIQACERVNPPIEAIHRLVTPNGRTTMDELVRRAVADWQVEQPRPAGQDASEPHGGHPYRSAPSAASSAEIIQVPDLPAADLIKLAEKRIDLTYLNPDLASWDFMQNERGKKYEVMTWAPGRDVSSADVRDYFNERRFSGNTAAFISWLMEKQPYGYHASIPEDEQLWCDPESGGLCAPYFYRDGARRRLDLHGVRDDWRGRWVFVAFREIPA